METGWRSWRRSCCAGITEGSSRCDRICCTKTGAKQIDLVVSGYLTRRIGSCTENNPRWTQQLLNNMKSDLFHNEKIGHHKYSKQRLCNQDSIAKIRNPDTNPMLSKFPALRRIGIYTILSYIALVLVNNSGYKLENMWLIYAPMFVTVYVFSRWVDSKLPADSTKNQKTQNKEN